MSKILFDERPLVIPVKTAARLGLEEAIILQQVHYWLQDKEKNKDPKSYHDGRYWVFNSYEEWKDTFPFWSISTIRRKIGSLEKSGYLISSNYNDLGTDRTKWYTVNYEVLERETQNEQTNSLILDTSDCPDGTNGTAQFEQMETPNLNRPLPKTTTETTPKTTIENKREPSADKFCGHEFSEPIQEKLTEWLTYKSERREGYKPTGLKSFMTEASNKLEKYTEEDVISLIGECMANNWKGICWEKLKGMEKPPKPVEQPIPQEILDAQKRREEGIKKIKAGEGSWRDAL